MVIIIINHHSDTRYHEINAAQTNITFEAQRSVCVCVCVMLLGWLVHEATVTVLAADEQVALKFALVKKPISHILSLSAQVLFYVLLS